MAPFGQQSRSFWSCEILQLFASTIFLELSTSQVLVVLFVVAFCYDFKLWRHYDYDILWPFLKGFPYSWSVCHCCKRHVFFSPRSNWTPSGFNRCWGCQDVEQTCFCMSWHRITDLFGDSVSGHFFGFIPSQDKLCIYTLPSTIYEYLI